ncbi:MAG TPA: twin-arginine translocase TatA/TatE family subunit [Kaistia sp.]|nr:twin-arginine translocase TatA/TatE family subunit [Kaistia sp.]
MGSLSIWHWLIVLVIVLLLFGKGKISDVMGDVAKGVKSFKKGLSDDDETVARPTGNIDHKPADIVTPTTDEKTRASS